ncbi:serine/threonine protein kinase [Noumeavirus]|uniref:serine/threonine protein kinase n=1 Tax=Noumeavirus TaxID=1955558 RepID=UPI000982D2E0|nr:serine/threonine protein kinase [Noumeavirus]AQM73319.1 serine/threonine protein kinase [Noumeavirus]
MKVRHERSEKMGINNKFSFHWSEICTMGPSTKLQNFTEKERLGILISYIRTNYLPYEYPELPESVEAYGQNWTQFNEMKGFEFLEKIGEGSYGHVYKVRHKNGREYALKLFDISFVPTRSPDHWDASLLYEFCIGRREAVFLLEATLEQKTKHIPKFYDFGFCIIDGKARSYILLEFIDGTNLFGACVGEQPAFESLVEQAFEAMKDIHSLGYAHCDISPPNIMVTKEGILKIIDFGTSCREDDASDYVMGSINPPENYTKRVADIEDLFAVDVWCAAYTLLLAARGRATKNLLPHEKTLVECLDELSSLIKEAEEKTKLPFVVYEALSLNRFERPRF